MTTRKKSTQVNTNTTYDNYVVVVGVGTKTDSDPVELTAHFNLTKVQAEMKAAEILENLEEYQDFPAEDLQGSIVIFHADGPVKPVKFEVNSSKVEVSIKSFYD